MAQRALPFDDNYVGFFVFERFNNDYRRWREQRRTVSELSRLSARQLEDIGITPYEIEDAARGKFRR